MEDNHWKGRYISSSNGNYILSGNGNVIFCFDRKDSYYESEAQDEIEEKEEEISEGESKDSLERGDA